jgi:hypothetical protein
VVTQRFATEAAAVCTGCRKDGGHDVGDGLGFDMPIRPQIDSKSLSHSLRGRGYAGVHGSVALSFVLGLESPRGYSS